MPIEIIDCEQGSPQWFAVRCGIPTASMFKSILADGAEKKMRTKYMERLAGEILSGEPEETYSNHHMERGKEQEDEARKSYAFMNPDAELHRVGFVRNGAKGCSPDSLIGTNGVLELKTALPSIIVEKFRKGTFPPEHQAQCQGALWITEREYVDLAIYARKMKLFEVRAHRNEGYIANLAGAVRQFTEELHELVEKVRSA